MSEFGVDLMSPGGWLPLVFALVMALSMLANMDSAMTKANTRGNQPPGLIKSTPNSDMAQSLVVQTRLFTAHGCLFGQVKHHRHIGRQERRVEGQVHGQGQGDVACWHLGSGLCRGQHPMYQPRLAAANLGWYMGC